MPGRLTLGEYLTGPAGVPPPALRAGTAAVAALAIAAGVAGFLTHDSGEPPIRTSSAVPAGDVVGELAEGTAARPPALRKGAALPSLRRPSGRRTVVREPAPEPQRASAVSTPAPEPEPAATPTVQPDAEPVATAPPVLAAPPVSAPAPAPAPRRRPPPPERFDSSG